MADWVFMAVSNLLEDYKPLGDIYGCQCLGPLCDKCKICIHAHKDGRVQLPDRLAAKFCNFSKQTSLFKNSGGDPWFYQ
jgi:hypothetical protein